MIFMVYFETERLVLRSWTQEDLPLFVAMNKDEEVMRYFPSTLSDEETTAFYERIQDEFRRNGWGLYAVEIKSTGEFIGYVGLHEIGFDAEFAPGVEIGWRLASRFHKQGYATEAAEAVVYGARRLGLRKLYSFTAKVNRPSERVMQKIGMTKAGEFKHPKLAPESPLLTHVLYQIDV